MASSRRNLNAHVYKGESFVYTATLKNEAGTGIDLNDEATITSFTITHYRADTGATVNSRNGQNILGTASGGVYPGANQHTLGNSGLLTWTATGSDTNVAVTAATTMVIRYTLVYTVSAVSRTAIHEATYTLYPLQTVS